MIVRIKRHKNYFAQIDRRALEDPRLSFKATGILAYLLSKPDGWQVRGEHLARVKKEGRDAVLKGLQELQTFGYARVVDERDEKGRYLSHTWEVREEPEGGFIQPPKGDQRPEPDFPILENPTLDNPIPSKKKDLSKNKIEKEKSVRVCEEEKHRWQRWGSAVVCSACHTHAAECKGPCCVGFEQI